VPLPADPSPGLRAAAERLPAVGVPIVRHARGRALDAVAVVAAAIGTDPTLPAPDRAGRALDVVAEILRQLHPLARQADKELQRRYQTSEHGPGHPAARRRTRRTAPEEMEEMLQRLHALADEIAADAQPDWDAPARVRERSHRLLPPPGTLAYIADQLREAVRPSLELAWPDPQARRLAALADQISPPPGSSPRCAGPGCGRAMTAAATGRRRKYCGDACRKRAARARTATATASSDLEKLEADRADLRAVLDRLPPDTRPLPSVAAYDALLHRAVPAPTVPPGPAALGEDQERLPPVYGQIWDDGDVCLWRDEGRWGLSGPDGDIHVPEFGLFGNDLLASDTTGAQEAAAAAVHALTGRVVTGWDRDEWSRSVYGPSSWHACLARASGHGGS
jgi:hypothetical protein